VASVNVRFAIAGRRVELEAEAPESPTKPAALLPLVRAVAEQVVQLVVDDARAAGRTVRYRPTDGTSSRVYA
jgi:hypothetical protein